jgi:hypothetical protein
VDRASLAAPAAGGLFFDMMRSMYFRCCRRLALFSLSAGMALLSFLLCQSTLAAQTHTMRVRKIPRIAWRRGPGAHDYVPPSNSPFPNVTYNGGPTVAHASYWMVYWGPYWTSGLGLAQRNYFNSYVENVAPSAGFTGQFAEYQEPGNPILTAGFAGEKSIATSPGSSIDDSTIRAQINSWILSGVLPVPDANTVFVMMMPAGTDVTANGQSGCGAFLGYHDDFPASAGNFGYFRYIMLPYQNCGADLGADGAVTVNGMTDTLSHEMAETETDPDYDYLTAAWIDKNTGNEMADICADTSATYGYLTFWFQKIWSDAAGTCIGASGSQSIHLTISTMAPVVPGSTEPSGAASILPNYPVMFTVSTDSSTPVSLSVSGLPSGVTYTLSQSTVTAGSSAALQVSTDGSPGPSGMATVTAAANSQQAQFQFLVVPWQQVSTVNVTQTSFVYNSSLQLYTGSITVENTGSQPVGPTILLTYHGLDSSMYSATVGASSPANFQDTTQPNEVAPNGDYVVQFPDGMLGPGQSVTQNVAFSNPNRLAISFTPQVFQVASAQSACSISQSATPITDVQLIVNQALGAMPATNDLNGDGVVDVVDVQIVTNAALGLGCSA